MNLHTVQQAADQLGLSHNRVRHIIRTWTKIRKLHAFYLLTDEDIETIRIADRDHPSVPTRGRRRKK